MCGVIPTHSVHVAQMHSCVALERFYKHTYAVVSERQNGHQTNKMNKSLVLKIATKNHL